MKSLKLALVFLLLAGSGITGAWAGHHGHVRFGVVIGPVWGSWHYPPPPYYYTPYYPPIIVERPAPTVYIEQPAATPAPTTHYWYYCVTAKGYYPYVRECPSGWQKVLPQPPGTP
ncbi:MAG: hypothetical protein HZC24_09505 [Rhodocyclales bacterium]|nr:hypothetical protein [Rhodocyclales bacterium]